MGWKLVDEGGVLRHRRVRAWPWWLPMLAIFGGLLLGLAGFSGVMRLEETNSYCASCHTEPEVTYVAQSAAGEESDLATLHSARAATRCIDCHSGRGTLGRLAAMRSTARRTWVNLIRPRTEPVVMDEALPDEFCLKCHDSVLVDASTVNHYHALLPRWQQNFPAAAGCGDCHAAHAPGGSPQAGFLLSGHPDPVCAACHRDLRRSPEGF